MKPSICPVVGLKRSPRGSFGLASKASFKSYLLSNAYSQKKFIASRNHNDGALILSRFAGASRELQGAIIVNPYDIEKSADAIKLALEMTAEEQGQRMKQMRLIIVRYNIFSWAAELLRTMATINH